MANETNRYSAFVSYRHMPRDRQWALRIMRELETYRTPKALQSEAFPASLGRLFRDEDEIPASTDLSDQIKDALARSDYLIVVCSPDTPASRWVRREIELFQEMGKSERIMPLLIAGEPDESFPPELRRRQVVVPRDDGGADFVWEEVEPVAADVRPRKDESRAKTDRRALMRLAAALLGCSFDALARRDKERRKTQLRQRLAAGGLLLSVASLGGLWWWDANLRVHTQYCANHGERWAVPFCVGELGEAEQRARKISYRLKTRGGLVREMARVNGADAPIYYPNGEYEDEVWTKGVSQWQFGYLDKAHRSELDLASTLLMNNAGGQLRHIGYDFGAGGRQGIARFDRGLGMTDSQSAVGSSLGLKALEGNEASRHSTIGQNRLFFDANGLLSRRSFEPLSGVGTVADATGSHGHSYEYDTAGLPEVIRNLDAYQKPLVEKTGIVAQRRTYDARSDLTSVEWLDAGGKLRANEQWFAKVVLVRDAKGNIEQENYLSESGAPVIRRDYGVASISYKYDEHGKMIDNAYFGADGKPALHKDGYARWTNRYDERGNIVEQAYFGVDDKLTFLPEGIARVTVRYDEHGKMVEKAFFGVDGKPTLHKDGEARITWGYDECGNQVEEACFGVDGKPALSTKGFARATSRYDEHGMEAEEAFLGVDGKPTLNHSGVARWTNRYDERGNKVEQAHFGVDGKPTLDKQNGLARVTWRYDEHGNQAEEAYFGVDGKPMLSKEGVAGWIVRYDEHGNLERSPSRLNRGDFPNRSHSDS